MRIYRKEEFDSLKEFTRKLPDGDPMKEQCERVALMIEFLSEYDMFDLMSLIPTALCTICDEEEFNHIFGFWKTITTITPEELDETVNHQTREFLEGLRDELGEDFEEYEDEDDDESGGGLYDSI